MFMRFQMRRQEKERKIKRKRHRKRGIGEVAAELDGETVILKRVDEGHDKLG